MKCLGAKLFGGQAVAESPAPSVHGCLFLTVSKISIGDGTCGFGESLVEGLPDIHEGIWLQLSEELLCFCGGGLRRCMIHNLPTAVTCVCLCVDDRFSPPPVTFLCVNSFSKYHRGLYPGVVSHCCCTYLCK